MFKGILMISLDSGDMKALEVEEVTLWVVGDITEEELSDDLGNIFKKQFNVHLWSKF